LPKDAAELSQKLGCEDDPTYLQTWSGVVAWTPEPGPHEMLAINQLTWPLAFAFCAWDGGRLPTEAEWAYAALGGDEQRTNPWGSEPADGTRASLINTILAEKKLRPVGSAPAGIGRWGHLDMGGNMEEMVFDAISHQNFYEVPCADCALINPYPYPELDGRRAKDYGSTEVRTGIQLQQRGDLLGVRCARD
jgi:formylglycine-generating enzyme required for sulfatase activity